MTYYKYFDDKTGVAKYIIEEMHKTGMKVYKDILSMDISYEAKVRLMIDMKMSNAHEMSQELINDIYKSKDEELFNTVENIKNNMLQVYIEDFKVAQKKGELRADVKPEFVLYFFNHLVDMLTDPEIVVMYSNPEQMISEVFGFIFYGLIPRNTVKHK
jgi:hypothetical protein